MSRHKAKRQESWRLKRVKESWRRPRGGTSRIRLEISGWPRKPSIGFRKDGHKRGLHPSGLVERLVKQDRDLDGLDPKKHIARIGHQVGERKRLRLVEKIRQLNVKLANPGSTQVAPVAEGPPAETEEPMLESAESKPDENSLIEEAAGSQDSTLDREPPTESEEVEK